MPGTLVWKSGPTSGMSIPRRSVPNTRVIAPTGQAVRQAPWPMQSLGETSSALPRIIPSTWCPGISGQALMQALQPMQMFGSITG